MVEKPDRFCYTCGHGLSVTTRSYAYDTQTGEPRTAYAYDCPARGRIVRFLGWGHPCTELEAYVMAC